jgi:uncharacterized membrane protein (UPF0127 family)
VTELAPYRHTFVTYRVGVRGLVSLGVVLAAIAVAASAAASTSKTAALVLDGSPIRPELALTSAQRTVGLMHRERAPAGGMLFVFPTDTTGGFWMKNTLVPLKIVFFDSQGRRVRTLRMTPCREDPCRIYDPGRRYRFALELPVTDTRPARVLGPLAQLRRLTRQAT